MRINARAFDIDNNLLGVFKIADYACPHCDTQETIKHEIKAAVRGAFKTDPSFQKKIAYIIVKLYNKKRKHRPIACIATKSILGCYKFDFKNDVLSKFPAKASKVTAAIEQHIPIGYNRSEYV